MLKKLITFSFCLLLLGCNSSSSTYKINETSTLEDFKGKPSVILFGGTYCPHCRDAVPEFKIKIWDKYKDKVNLWVNVIDKSKFDVPEIAQGFNNLLNYDTISQKECQYVPSWIVLDSSGNTFDSSCGADKSLDDMANDIEKLINAKENK